MESDKQEPGDLECKKKKRSEFKDPLLLMTMTDETTR